MKADQRVNRNIIGSITSQAFTLWQTRTLPVSLFVFSLLSVLVFWTQLGRLAWVGQVVLFLITCVLALLVAAFLVRAVFVFHLQQMCKGLDPAQFSENSSGLEGLARQIALKYNESEQASGLLVEALRQERDRLAKLELCMNGFSLELWLGETGDLTVLDIQAGVERFLPITKEAVRSDWAAFMAHVDPKHQQALVTALCRNDAFPAQEVVVFGLKRRAGESPLFLQMTILRQATDQGIRLLAVCMDVTDLVLARQVAEKADVAKTEFLATMSHELRTPLNAIVGFARLLEDQLEPGGQLQNDAKSISVAARSLNHILTDILDFSRVEAQGVQLEESPFNIKEIVGQVHALNKPLADQKKLEFTCLVDQTNPLWVSGDFNRLRQIIQNLVSNALKFTSHGFVRMKLQSTQAQNGRVDVFIEVADSGIGIGQAGLRKLFKRFSQASRSINREFGGTGLGLAISKGLVELMGGRIEVTSEPGVGSVFTVCLNLPIAASVAPTVEVKAVTKDKVSLSILLVDDHPMNLKLLDRYLSKRDHHVNSALGGLEALDLTRTKTFDLILMDIDMPEMDGYQTTMAIRSDEGNLNQQTFVCALSGLSDEASKQQCMDAGMQKHLAKPVQFDQLDVLVQELCKHKLENLAALASS